MGFRATGLEVRDSSIAACRWVQSRVNLPQLSFVQDDAWNAGKHGTFDAVFCCGLLYRIDRPRAFIKMLSQVAQRVVILQTHFATDRPQNNFNLTEMCENENAAGRWYAEFATPPDPTLKESSRWSSWDNTRSFWLTRGWLLQCLVEGGFDLVFEQFDSLRPSIVDSMNAGYYHKQDRGTFDPHRHRQQRLTPYQGAFARATIRNAPPHPPCAVRLAQRTRMRSTRPTRRRQSGRPNRSRIPSVMRIAIVTLSLVTALCSAGHAGTDRDAFDKLIDKRAVPQADLFAGIFKPKVACVCQDGTGKVGVLIREPNGVLDCGQPLFAQDGTFLQVYVPCFNFEVISK